MNPVRYIFINRGLKMTPGKIAAQAAHAEMLAMEDFFRRHHNDEARIESGRLVIDTDDEGRLYNEWIGSGHYTKLVMLAEDSEHLHTIERYLRERGYKTYLVIDEGRTEIARHSPTAMAVELVDKDEERVQQHFGEFRTYKEKKPEPHKKFGRKRK